MDFFYWFAVLALFILGSIIGSFLNCVILRSRAGESYAAGRSHCPSCRHELCWNDLIPLASFAFLGGRCRYCRGSISWQYPLVEFAAGLLFAVAANVFVPDVLQPGILHPESLVKLAYYGTVISALIVIFVYDLRWYAIPDGALLAGFSAAVLFYGFLLLQTLVYFHAVDWDIILNPLISGLAAMAVFLAIFLLSRGAWMGFGDVKYAALMGFILGFPDIAVGMFMAFLFGAILGLALISARKKDVFGNSFRPVSCGGNLSRAVVFRADNKLVSFRLPVNKTNSGCLSGG